MPYERVREAIAVALLAPGHHAPSVRALALELDVARDTVEQAYGLLAAEGYLPGPRPGRHRRSPRAGAAASSWLHWPCPSLAVAEGQARLAGARMAVATPAHHSPLSVTLYLPRRHALLQG